MAAETSLACFHEWRYKAEHDPIARHDKRLVDSQSASVWLLTLPGIQQLFSKWQKKKKKDR